MSLIWPARTDPQPDLAARLGRLIHWGGLSGALGFLCLSGYVWFGPPRGAVVEAKPGTTFTYEEAVGPDPAQQGPRPDRQVAPVLLGFAVGLYFVGRGSRYLLAGE